VAYSLGVDLGTTFVAAAMCDGSRLEMVTLGTRAVVMPAAVYVGAGGDLLCGEVALRQAAINPDAAALGFKRRLGDPVPVRLADLSRSPAQLMGVLLREVLRVVTETEGAPPESVMLTHPANWGPYRRGLFEEVAVEAGLDVDVPTVTEPVAAAAHYAASRALPEGEIVAVYDLGGGTFDVSVLRARPDHVEILGVPEGIERLGGVDFDDALLAHVDHVSGQQLSSLDPRDSRAMVALARVRQDCVLAKEALSVDSEAVIPVFLPDQAFDVTVTREQFEDLIRAKIESTLGALERTLRSSQLTPADIDTVLLVGGSSRIPLVARMVTDAIGAPTSVDTHPKYAVALGAAGLAAGARRAPMVPVGPRPVATADPDTPIRVPAEPLAAVSPLVTPRRPPAEPAEPEPGPPGSRTLCVVSGEQRIEVQPTERFVIGRDAGVQLRLTNPHVSRQHAVLETVNGAWLFTDTSRNGTFLDGRSINQLVVNDAVTLCLGDDTDGATVELIPDRLPDSPADVTLHRMAGSRVRIGRQPDNDMVLDDPLISRQHAELRRTPQGWQLVDLSSSNGTFVNGRRVGTATLAPGDVIGLGYGNYRFDGGWLVLCNGEPQNT
jgi:pSer/pThr/pTyr-binding forkhead associated (FHA) protein/actin-like ATPase involved in cell morphogenesis